MRTLLGLLCLAALATATVDLKDPHFSTLEAHHAHSLARSADTSHQVHLMNNGQNVVTPTLAREEAWHLNKWNCSGYSYIRLGSNTTAFPPPPNPSPFTFAVDPEAQIWYIKSLAPNGFWQYVNASGAWTFSGGQHYEIKGWNWAKQMIGGSFLMDTSNRRCFREWRGPAYDVTSCACGIVSGLVFGDTRPEGCRNDVQQFVDITNPKKDDPPGGGIVFHKWDFFQRIGGTQNGAGGSFIAEECSFVDGPSASPVPNLASFPSYCPARQNYPATECNIIKHHP